MIKIENREELDLSLIEFGATNMLLLCINEYAYAILTDVIESSIDLKKLARWVEQTYYLVDYEERDYEPVTLPSHMFGYNKLQGIV